MNSCQQISIMCLVPLLMLSWSFATATPASTSSAQHLQTVEEPQFVVITEDVIPDVENTTQKVIRVNPLDLPTARDDPTTGSGDSSLYKIQSLLPARRNYVNSNRMRRPRPPPQSTDTDNTGSDADSPIIRQLPSTKAHKPKQKQKHLHFLYNQEGLDGRVVGKSMRVHVAPGAYPVYYAVSKSNGRFGKFPMKSFRNQEDFLKYVVKNKLHSIGIPQHNEKS